MRTNKTRLFTILSIMLVAACSTNSAQNDFPAISYASEEPFMMDVSSVEFVQDYKPTEKSVEESFPVSPVSAVKQWSIDRLKPKGAAKVLRVHVIDAAITEQKLKVTDGWKGYFKKEPSEKYSARLEVALKIMEEGSLIPESEASAVVTRTANVREDASAAERRALKYKLVKQLMDDYNAEMTKQVKSYFTKHMSYQ